MPFDSAVDPRDTTHPRSFQPNLRVLAHVLRHPEMWPESFVWDYGDCDHCAMALAFQFWPCKGWRPEGLREWRMWACDTLILPPLVVDSLFFRTRPPKQWYLPASWRRPAALRNVTPEHVARAIERYLATGTIDMNQV